MGRANLCAMALKPRQRDHHECYITQTCHFDLTQNLNECVKKSEYTEKNLNLTTKIALLIYIEISTKFKAKKNLNLESVYMNFSKFYEKNLKEWKVCITDPRMLGVLWGISNFLGENNKSI